MDALNLIVLRHLVNLPWPGSALGQELAALEIGVGPTRAENGEGQFPIEFGIQARWWELLPSQLLPQSLCGLNRIFRQIIVKYRSHKADPHF